MIDVKIEENDINKIIDIHGLRAYARSCWNVDLDTKEILYQLNLTELGKYKRLYNAIECLIYNTTLKVARKEYRSAKLRSKKPKSVKVN